MDGDATYLVLREDEGQYSLRLAGRQILPGWYQAGRPAAREECPAYADQVRTSTRTRGLRERVNPEARP